MHLTTSSFALGIVLLGFLAIGLSKARRQTRLSFAINSAATSSYSLSLSILASLVGGFMFIGLTTMAFEAGTIAFLIGIGYVFGLIGLAVLTPRIYQAMRSSRSHTLDDFVGSRFGSFIQAFVTSVNFVFFVAVLGAQFLAFSNLISAIFPESLVIYYYLFFGAVVVSYVAASGYQGVLYTDRVQFYVILLVITILCLTYAPRFSLEKFSQSEAEYKFGLTYGYVFLVGVIVLFPFSILARTDLWQRIASAKSERDIKKSILIVCFILPLFYAAFTYIGIYYHLTFTGGSNIDTAANNKIIYYLLNSFLFSDNINSMLQGIVVVGIASALISTIDTNLNVVSIAVSNFLLKKTKTDDAHSLKFYRIATVVIGVIGLTIPFFFSSIIDLIVGAGTLLTIMLPLVILALFGPYPMTSVYIRASAIGLSGGYSLFIYLFVFGDPKTAFLPSTLVAIAPLILAKLYTILGLKAAGESQ